MKKREEKKLIKLEFSSNYDFFEHILKKSAHPLFGAWSHSSWSPFGLHLARSPNTFLINFFLRNQTMEVGPSSHAIAKRPSSHGVNRPLYSPLTLGGGGGGLRDK